MNTVQKHIEHLQRTYEQGDVIAVAIWVVDDVLTRAKERKIKITKKQAEDILSTIERHQDATLGITWDTLDCYIDDVK
uniref:Uncharacterized protein n=1 Tax=viral metagenome TaxID=1070528 RepID=A0A6M3JZE4_9ZZZZ